MLVKFFSSKKYSNLTGSLFIEKIKVCELGRFSGNNLRFLIDKKYTIYGVEINSQMIEL